MNNHKKKIIFNAVPALMAMACFLRLYPLFSFNQLERVFAQSRPARIEIKASTINSPEPTSTPSSPAAEPPPAVTNKTYASFFAHPWDIPLPAGRSDFWIEVDLSDQKLHTYQGGRLLKSFSISSGTRKYPTVPGEYKVFAKYTHYTMRGPGYYLPNVPYVLFFYKGYSIHGTYWHHNFGIPMSHGCVNMETGAAEWLFNQAQIGTPVFVHQ